MVMVVEVLKGRGGDDEWAVERINCTFLGSEGKRMW